MNRIVEFRGKSIKTGEWVYGYYFTKLLCDGEPRHHYIKFDGNDGIEVRPDSVGEFTGFYDKNGRQIFEGDIIEKPRGDSMLKFWVSFETQRNGLHRYRKNGIEFNRLDKVLPFKVEVIGNIHDNPIKPE